MSTVAPRDLESNTSTSVVGLTVIVVGSLLTVTDTLTSSAAAYLSSSPANEIVMLALPPATAVILPSASTVATLSLLDLYDRLPAAEGVKAAVI